MHTLCEKYALYMSPKEGKDCVDFLTSVFSMPIKVPLIYKKYFLNTFRSWVYILDILFVCSGYFLWVPKTHVPVFNHCPLCHIELTL